jgi:hypothetical protein
MHTLSTMALSTIAFARLDMKPGANRTGAEYPRAHAGAFAL